MKIMNRDTYSWQSAKRRNIEKKCLML